MFLNVEQKLVKSSILQICDNSRHLEQSNPESRESHREEDDRWSILTIFTLLRKQAYFSLSPLPATPILPASINQTSKQGYF